MTSDGVNSYIWNRANRLLTWNNGVAAALTNHAYDGEGRRVSQAIGTTSPTVTKYLLDIQPGLAVVLSETTSANTMRYVHSPKGIHAHKDTGDNWEWMVQDGLGSVREVVDNSVGVLESRNYDPYGNAFGATGTSQTGFGFTGELVDGSGLLDLRARRYNAGLGAFASLDPFEGVPNRAMSLNGYSWVEGNVPNWTDPLGAAVYEIWVAAFIAPEFLRFPFGYDPFAVWHGDNHSWFTLSDSIDNPHNSRVWWSVRLDTENLSNVQKHSEVGKTSVAYARFDGNGIFVEEGYADKPSEATITCQNSTLSPLFSKIEVGISASARNPLTGAAAPIEINYIITIGGVTMGENTSENLSGGSIAISGELDRYPWHEVYIKRTDIQSPKAISYVHKEPATGAENPALLFLPAYSFFQQDNDYDPVVINCNQNQVDLTRVMDRLGISC